MRHFKNVGFAALALAPAAALLLAGAFAQAKPAPSAEASLPAPVAAWLRQARQDCPNGFQNRDAVEAAEITGDGRPGYIADPHRLSCAGEPHLYSGDGPASIELFVTLPSGEVVHTGGIRALGYRVTPGLPGEAPTLTFQTHADNERAGSVDSYRWDGRNFELLNKSSMAVPPVAGPDAEYQR